MTTATKTADWETAYNAVPDFCEADQYRHFNPRYPLLPGDWPYLIDIVILPIQITLIEGGDAYTRREARQCVRWLRKYAPSHPMASL